MTRSKLDKVNRKKVVALITIEVHARDSVEKLSKSGCDAVTDFEWVSQLRFYWDHDKDDCVVKQVSLCLITGTSTRATTVGWS